MDKRTFSGLSAFLGLFCGTFAVETGGLSALLFILYLIIFDTLIWSTLKGD